MTKVVGIDPSLTNTGIAIVDNGKVSVRSIPTKPKGKSLEDRWHRLNSIRNDVCMAAWDADVVVIEGPAYAKSMGSMHDRSGLWWMILDFLYSEEEFKGVIYQVPPTSRAKYAVRGNAGKDEVLLTVAKRYPNIDFSNNDEADALVLAAMGCRLIDEPLEDSLAQTNLDALKKIER